MQPAGFNLKHRDRYIHRQVRERERSVKGSYQNLPLKLLQITIKYKQPDFKRLSKTYEQTLHLKRIRVCAKLLQSFMTLCSPTDCNPPGFSVHGILQARILESQPFSSPGDLPDPGIEPRSPRATGEAQERQGSSANIQQLNSLKILISGSLLHSFRLSSSEKQFFKPLLFAKSQARLRGFRYNQMSISATEFFPSNFFFFFWCMCVCVKKKKSIKLTLSVISKSTDQYCQSQAHCSATDRWEPCPSLSCLSEAPHPPHNTPRPPLLPAPGTPSVFCFYKFDYFRYRL